MTTLRLLGLILMYLIIGNSDYSVHPPQSVDINGVKTVDHSPWDTLLKKHVDTAGNVDYSGFKKDSRSLKAYLDYLNEITISDTAKKEERLAFYINLYNAATIQLIVENYPLNSIKDIVRPWGKERIFIQDNAYSLGNIEHGILRKMNEPRIHFAINCASFSCPKLMNEAYTGLRMEEQLERATKDFINDPKKNIIAKDAVQLSKIFKWYKRDFTTNGSLIDYLNLYTDIKVSKKCKISFLTYDWRLNESG